MEFQVGPVGRRSTEQKQCIVLLIMCCLQGPAFVSESLEERDVSC